MKKLAFLLLFALPLCSLYAQKKETVTVKAGTKLSDYFSASEKYLYPSFTHGNCLLKNGKTINSAFNYNLLSGEMDFLKGKDTLSISDTKDIQSIVVVKDTFYYADRCLKLIKSGRVGIYKANWLELKEIQKEGAMGTKNRTRAVDSYNYIFTYKDFKNLKSESDMVLQKKEEFYLSVNEGNYIISNKKNVLKLVPEKEDEVKEFIKSNKINFASQSDLLKLSAYLGNILPKKK